ncbi:uncharacterized protein MYCFIDRAFT_133529 [Pseudocercospora fijiensis CIRAD86]|uniref:Piwi domain-containing protein n=1 Tax=Pseudocercospora fijiensis (strain CIRAD86) TaxID=383855 RepID=M3A1P4_PSEFD|nr:uncharacterized protein MYCFIDRAFT_133529 [Pseudocercospora fijiensis CIRAD86]EME85099.1 hypothetical protein MYCFIDRAFT_133529 [Pseudocercospora fijiensis CIRAD86]
MSNQPRGRGQGRGGARGRGDSAPSRGRGDYQGGGGRGGFRGDRGGGGPPGRGQSTQMSFRGGRGGGGGGGGGGSGGIYLSGSDVPQPDASITAAENALVPHTRDRMFDESPGFTGFPGRRGYATKGTPITLRTNYLKLTTAYELNMADQEQTLFRYDVDVRQEISRPKRRALLDQIVQQHPKFNGVHWATDYARTVVTTKKLDLDNGTLEDKRTLPGENAAQQPQASARNTYDFKITYQDSFSPRHLIEYLRSTSAGAAYAGRTDVVQLMNIVLTKAPNGANAVRNVGQKFYPYHGHPGKELYDLGGGLQALRGYYSSIRPAVNRLLVNLNVTAGAFYQPGPLLQLWDEARIHGNLDQLEAFFRMLKVDAAYIKDGQQKPFRVKIKTIIGFAKATDKIQVQRFGNANQVRFRFVDSSIPNATARQITVNDYFRQYHGITLRHPDRPVLNVGTRADPQYLPAELCTVRPGQPYRRLLSGDQTSEMLKFAARFPNLNAMSITGTPGAGLGNGLRLFRLADPTGDPQSTSVKPFGFSVGTSMITVPGRILDTPRVSYGSNSKPVTPQKGSWNLQSVRFTRPGRFDKWSVLIINRKGNRGNALLGNPTGDMLAPEKLINEVEQSMKSYGINMGQRVKPTQEILLETLVMQNRDFNNRQLRNIFAKAESIGIRFLFIIIPEADKWLYARIKYFGDVEFGIHTVCSVGSKLQKPNGQGMYIGNLALKFNLKGGGVAHHVPNTFSKPLDNKTMLFGIDVTHPSPGSSKGAPSIAALVASVDEHLFQWPGSIRTQDSRQEMVDGLEEMVIERLNLWRKKNNFLPNKVIIYRDGVSEGQYRQVLQMELPSFEKAFTKLYGSKEKWPKMTIIIVGKRHHTRFYPTREQDADYNPQRQKGSWNPLPGTVVDRGIADKILYEFWLQAHSGLQGTARPAHYVVIKDEIKFEADELQQFTHYLCYLFSRATKAVSICPPAYYADLLCERGRAYLFSVLAESHGSDSSVFNAGQEWSRDVHPRLAESTWYI